MNTTEFLRYKIQKEDTLTLVAKRVGVNSIDLKTFHNRLCSQEERIYFDDLSYYNFIYIPFYQLSNQELLKEKYSERPFKNFNPQFYDSTYIVEETFNFYSQEEFTISYSVELKFNEENHISVQLYDFKKNDEAPDDKISLLALACTKSISPFSVKISSEGEIISFVDHKSIVKNFQDNRNNIEEYHTGEIAKNYLDTFEISLKNETYFLNQIKNTPLFQLLFPKLEWFYKTASWTEKLFIEENNFELTAEYFHDDRIFLNTIIKGKSDQNKELRINYKTEKHTKKIVEISANISSQNIQHNLKIIPKPNSL